MLDWQFGDNEIMSGYTAELSIVLIDFAADFWAFGVAELLKLALHVIVECL